MEVLEVLGKLRATVPNCPAHYTRVYYQGPSHMYGHTAEANGLGQMHLTTARPD